MKKLFMLVVSIFLVLNCGYIKEYPTSTLELAKGGDDTSTYNFESSDHGFILTAAADNLSFVSKELSSERAYKGKKSLKIKCDYRGITNYKGGLLSIVFGTPQNFAGKKLTAHIWIPGTAFDEKAPYGSNFYVKSGAPSWAWYQSPGQWTNLKQGTVVVDGVWTEIKVNVDEMTTPSGTLIPNSEKSNIVEFGIKVGQGDYSKNFDGYIYIDSINIE